MKIFKYEQSSMEVVKSTEPVIFLAGPTVRSNQQHLTSWRFDAVKEFLRQDFQGSLVIPEFMSPTQSDKGKAGLPLWEFNGLKRADCILFWIPRTKELIGLTTNWELGYWMGKEPSKVVYGRPDDAYRIDYLDIMWKANWERHQQTFYNTLENTVAAAIEIARGGYNG